MGTSARLMPTLRAMRSMASRFFEEVLTGGSVGNRALMRL